MQICKSSTQVGHWNRRNRKCNTRY